MIKACEGGPAKGCPRGGRSRPEHHPRAGRRARVAAASAPGRERRLEVVSARIPVDIEHFAGKEEVRSEARLHRLRVHLIECDAAGGRHRDREAADATDREREAAEDPGKAAATVPVQPRPGRLLREPGLGEQAPEQPLGEAERSERGPEAGGASLAAEPDEAGIERVGSDVRHEGDEKPVAGPDVAREVEHPRPGEARMGEEQVAPPGRDLPAVADDREACVPDRDAGEIGERVRLGFDRGQRRTRFHDRVTERAGEPVAVPGRARARIRRPSRREHHGPGPPGSRVGPDRIAVVDPFDRAHAGSADDPDAVLAAGGAQGCEHVVGACGRRERPCRRDAPRAGLRVPRTTPQGPCSERRGARGGGTGRGRRTGRGTRRRRPRGSGSPGPSPRAGACARARASVRARRPRDRPATGPHRRGRRVRRRPRPRRPAHSSPRSGTIPWVSQGTHFASLSSITR